jgi:hypothetical protein
VVEPQLHISKGADIDNTEKYRYSLWRSWDDTKPRALFIMLNPSTADANEDDPTVRRCIGFARDWKYGSIEVVNLFAYRATDPSELLRAADPIGPKNDTYIQQGLSRSSLVILAWGTKGTLKGRDREVISAVKSFEPHCLEKTKDGHPKHPLYTSKMCLPLLFD